MPSYAQQRLLCNKTKPARASLYDMIIIFDKGEGISMIMPSVLECMCVFFLVKPSDAVYTKMPLIRRVSFTLLFLSQ